MSLSTPSRLDALLTGIFYLGLGLTGAPAFVGIWPLLFVERDPAASIANLIEQERLVRISVALVLGSVIFQTLTGIWFARLFRAADTHAANTIALFSTVIAVATLASAVMLRVALDVAAGPGADESQQLSYALLQACSRFWEFGAIFFGLWLMPMGWLVLKARYGPRALGWTLITGSICYVLSVFISVLAPAAGIWVAALPILATIGEFWMIGLLFWKGLHRKR